MIVLDPTAKGVNLFSGFVQDTIRFWDDRLRLSLGAKLEHNDYTGFEIQPDARILWAATPDQTLWAAVSRAVRTPARIDHDISFTYGVLAPDNPRNPSSIPLLLTIAGNREFQSEELLAYECGYRIKATDRLSADLAFFYNVYDSLRTGEPDHESLRFALAPALHAQMTTVLDNKMKGETYGAEISTDWRMLDWWRFQAAYTYLQIQMHPTDDSLDSYNETATEGMAPHSQFSLRSTMNLPHNLELDGWFRYVDRLPDIGVGSYANVGVDSYATIDLRLGWRPRENLEVSLVGQNLLEDRHLEFLAGLHPHPSNGSGKKCLCEGFMAVLKTWKLRFGQRSILQRPLLHIAKEPSSMRHFRDLSIKRKMTWIMMLTSGVVLFLSSAAFLTIEMISSRRSMVENLATLADIIGNNCIAALTFNDPKTVEETLGALKAETDIASAYIFEADGMLFASYTREGLKDAPAFEKRQAFIAHPPRQGAIADTYQFEDKRLGLTKPIVFNGEVIGAVHLHSELRKLTFALEKIRPAGLPHPRVFGGGGLFPVRQVSARYFATDSAPVGYDETGIPGESLHHPGRKGRQ